jgi:hypothetical protein
MRVEVVEVANTVSAFRGAHDEMRQRLMVTPRALAALERQADREGMTLGELVGCLLEKAASQLLIEESVASIRLGSPCDDHRLVEQGFDIGGGDA